MKLSWAEQAWEDYLYWQKTDQKILRRINRIVLETKRNPFKGIGDPEPQHRFVYKAKKDELLIAQCRYHY